MEKMIREKKASKKSSPIAINKPVRARKSPAARQEASGGDQSARIAETAYYLAEKRGFEPGHELEDWFEAEKIVANGGAREMASHA
jgi:hypothetical protein